MKTKEIREAAANWLDYLKIEEEKSENTLKQYSRTLDHFITFLEANQIETIDKKAVLDYKTDMLQTREANLKNPQPGRKQLKSMNTVNLRLITVTKFLRDSGEPNIKIKIENETTSNTLDDMITENEYRRILEWADKLGKEKIKLIIETLVGTGIRISELKAITVEALKTRTNTVTNKNKTRTIFIPKQLAKKLRSYCKDHDIQSGIIFHGTDPNKLLDQTYIRKEMKIIAGKARGIKKDKIHPHIFRHLFAKRYANMPGANPFVLPMLLGHSDRSQGVTALYIKPTTKELLKIVDDLEAYYLDNGKSSKTKRNRKRKVNG